MQHVTEQCKVLNFGDLGDERGKLVVVEGGMDVPFEIKRVFYIYGRFNRLFCADFEEF